MSNTENPNQSHQSEELAKPLAPLANIQAIKEDSQRIQTALANAIDSVENLVSTLVEFHNTVAEYVTTVTSVVNEAQGYLDAVSPCPTGTIPVYAEGEIVECMRAFPEEEEDLRAEGDECPEGFSAYVVEDTYGNAMTFCSQNDSTYNRSDVRREMLGEAYGGT